MLCLEPWSDEVLNVTFWKKETPSAHRPWLHCPTQTVQTEHFVADLSSLANMTDIVMSVAAQQVVGIAETCLQTDIQDLGLNFHLRGQIEH